MSDATHTTTGPDELRLVPLGDRWPDRDDRSALSQAEQAALAEMAATPLDAPMMPGVNWPEEADAVIRALWRAQVIRNQTNDKYKPDNWRGKFTERERAEIRSLYATGIYSQRTLARLFECSQTAIWDAIHRSAAA